MNINRPTRRDSRLALACAAWTILAVGIAGCSAGYSTAGGTYAVGVGTTYGPYWYPYNYGTYSIVNYPWWGDPPPPPENDPRRHGSVTQVALHDQLRDAFAARGYRHLDADGDVDIAVYASSEDKLNISGYTHDYNWRNVPKLKDKNEYPKGTVVVDVLAPKTHELLWRGTTVAPVSSDPDKYAANLREAVNRIAAKYPKSKH